MKTGLDVISLAVNVMTIVDTVIKLLADLQKAYERQAELPNILEAHRKELRNTRAIVDIVMKENALQIHAIVSDLKDIDDYGNRLRECLDNLSKDRSLIQQYTHQLFKGSKKMAQLSDIMQGLSLSRGNLVLKIQVAHVGLTRAYGNALLVNQKIVEHVNELLQKVLGHGNDLKITEVLRRHGIKQGASDNTPSRDIQGKRKILQGGLTCPQLMGRYSSMLQPCTPHLQEVRGETWAEKRKRIMSQP